jgi:hypothetical protein
MIKETTRNFEELRKDNYFQNVWDKAAIVSENNYSSEPKLPPIKSVSFKLVDDKKKTIPTAQYHFRINIF